MSDHTTLKARYPEVFATVEEAVDTIRKGGMVIVVDDEDRENEGDLIMAAEKVTPEAINFMAVHGRGLICLSLTEDRFKYLRLEIPVEKSHPDDTNFGITVDAAHGITTGSSAHDRARTIRIAVDPHARPEDLIRPGHVFTLRAMPGGVLDRPGHTEASVDLARLAGLYPAGVLCEVLNEDGSMARLPDLIRFAQKHGLKILTIKDLVEYRLRNEGLVVREAEAHLPTRFGDFRVVAYEDRYSRTVHLALLKGDPSGDEPVLVRIHSECVTGDLLGSLRCDCGDQMEDALRAIEAERRGVFIYLRQEGRGIGLLDKIRAYRLQDNGLDTVEANEALGHPPDARDYVAAYQILRDLGVKQVRLLTNNPHKVQRLQELGVEVVERVPMPVRVREENLRYLLAKRDKLGHLLDGVEQALQKERAPE